MPKVYLILCLCMFFSPCFGTKTVLFLVRESCIRHSVMLVYTSSVRQALAFVVSLKLMGIHHGVSRSIKSFFSEVTKKWMETKQFRIREWKQILTVKWKMRWKKLLTVCFITEDFPLLCIKRDAPCQLQINWHFDFLNFPTASSLLHVREILVRWLFPVISGPQKFGSRQTKLGDIGHEQTTICRQWFVGHMVGYRPVKRKKHLQWMIRIIFILRRKLLLRMPFFIYLSQTREFPVECEWLKHLSGWCL